MIIYRIMYFRVCKTSTLKQNFRVDPKIRIFVKCEIRIRGFFGDKKKVNSSAMGSSTVLRDNIRTSGLWPIRDFTSLSECICDGRARLTYTNPTGVFDDNNHNRVYRARVLRFPFRPIFGRARLFLFITPR